MIDFDLGSNISVDPNITLACCGLMTKIVHRFFFGICSIQIPWTPSWEISKFIRTVIYTNLHNDLWKSYIVQVEKSTCFKTEQTHEWYLLHHQCLTHTNPTRYKEFSTAQPSFMAIRWTKHFQPGLTCCKIWCTCYSVSASTHMQFLLTSRECFFK